MTTLLQGIWKLRIWKETRGQDLVEYALLGGFVATMGAAVFPALGSDVVGVFTKVIATLASFGGSTGVSSAS
ncbi:MAG: Flp family type IVb pilin [Acidobacteriia bacterium]|nr:Flp family type IVb pilin [Terriglobia bacterium]